MSSETIFVTGIGISSKGAMQDLIAAGNIEQRIFLIRGHKVMLSSVLHGKRAARINIRIVQTFIRLREWALTHKNLARTPRSKWEAPFKQLLEMHQFLVGASGISSEQRPLGRHPYDEKGLDGDRRMSYTMLIIEKDILGRPA